jgi:deoxyribonuclease-4
MLIGHNINSNIDINNISDISNIEKETNYFQIFTADPTKYQYFNSFCMPKKVKKYLKKNNIGIVIHGSFCINLARSPNDKIALNSINLLKNDIKICNDIDALGVVIHMGKDTEKKGEEKALENYVTNLERVLEETQKAIIILETGANCGSEVGSKLNKLGLIRDKCKNKDRIKFCIDTCHIYSSGYDIADEKYIDILENYIDNTLGWNNVIIAHINDSKDDLCSKKDRHADLTDGDISKRNLNSFMKFINNFVRRNIPMILETPSDKISYNEQIKLIKFYCSKYKNKLYT